MTVLTHPEIKQQVSEQEWQMRVDLAACYRLIAMYGWDDLVFTHISARVPSDSGEHHFLINPYGLMFEEVCASNLVKVDLQGNPVVDTPYPVNPAGFNIHSAVHEVRDDANCVLHLHTNAGVAVSILEQGLEPLSQHSLFPLSGLAYHGYEGVALNPDEQSRLQADLGEKNFMILRNHGLLTCGSSIADAFLAMFMLQRACEIQLMAQGTGKALVGIPQPILDGIAAQSKQVTKGQMGMLAWPGLLRKLDRIDSSYRE